MNRQVVEWAPFKLAPGVTEENLLASSEKLQDGFLAKQAGFLRRELIRGSDGGYVDVVWWASEEDARTAMGAAATSAACAAYFSAMEPDLAEPGAGVSHFAQVRAYG